MPSTETVTDAVITARKLSNAGSQYTYRDGTAQMQCGPAALTETGGGTFVVYREGQYYRVFVEPMKSPEDPGDDLDDSEDAQ